MEFDDLQRAWQAQNPAAQVTIKAEMLLKEVRRNQRSFWATIFWRDVREVGVAFLLVWYFLYHGSTHHHLWTDYLNAVACLGVGTFMVVDRMQRRKQKPLANDALKHCLEVSLAEVKHQIWLLKNVFWWYLLPLLAGQAVTMINLEMHRRHFDVGAAIGLATAVLLVAGITWWVYGLNQRAVRKCLEPRREELEALLASLG